LRADLGPALWKEAAAYPPALTERFPFALKTCMPAQSEIRRPDSSA